MNIKLLRLKRVLCTVLFVLLLNVVGMTKVYAYSFSVVCETGQTLYYNIIDAENHYVELTHPGSGLHYYSWSGFTKPTGNIILPTNVQYDSVTYTLTSIGDYAFFECSGLTGTLTIPNSVISIGKSAFDGCSNFTGALVIPNSVTSIGIEAFGMLEKITSLTIPNSITSISDWTFCYCNELSSVTIPNSVTSIGEFAFAYSSNIASITIGNSVTSIGEHAFSRCSRLTSVFIPNSVTSIGENPFDQCSSLAQIVVGSGNSAYDSRNNCNAIIHTSTNCLISGCKNTVIPNTITSIGNDAFLVCSGMTGTLTIPNSVISIGDSAFDGCWNLTGTLIIPNSVTSIGRYAFSFCLGLTGTLTIPNSVISIGEYAFEQCTGIEQVIVDSGNPVYDSRDSCNAIIRTNANRLIFGCKNTIIPNSVTSIEVRAFYQCSDLTSIIIPNSVTSIGNTSFYGCSSLISLTIGNSVTTIGQQAFYGCTNLESMTVLVETPPTIGTLTFQNCPKAIPVYVPCESAEEAYTTANWGGFSNFIGFCGGTVSVAANPEEGGTVTGGGVFGADETCTVMATENEGYSFAIWTQNGRSVSNHAEYTFYVAGEMDLVAHFVPNANITFADSNVKAICVSHWDTDGDGELSYVEAATVSNLSNYFRDNSVITSFDELQYFIGLALIGGYEFYGCTGLTSIEIPNSMTSIGKYAFSGCTGLTSIEIPNSVTSIGSSAFQSCRSLTSVEIPNSVTTIGSNAFEYCSGLTSIEIPNTVTSIGSYSFRGCSGLTSIEIPNTVTSIGNYAFYYCTGLTSMTVLAETPPILGGNNVFYYVNKSIPVSVPCNTAEAYQNAEGWNEFTNIQELCTQSQTITLSQGWNWFSTNVEITLEDLKSALVATGDTTITIKSKDNGMVTYNGSIWRGQLTALDLTQMYRISVDTACEISLEGMPINPAAHPITIHNGANWIAFPFSESMSLNDAFDGFAVSGDVVKSKSNGIATFNGTQWRGTLNTLVPGQGYIYKSNVQEDRTFTFPTNAK